MKTYLLIEMKAKPSQTDALSSVLSRLRTELPLVPGCHEAQPLTHRDDENSFIVLEQWESIEAHKAHLNQLQESGAWEGLLALLQEPPRATYLRRL